jgi:hypothetical protein
MKNFRILIQICIISSLITLNNCSPKIANSGFLSNYDNLIESEANASLLSYISPNFEKGKYKKFIVDDIVVKFSEKAKGSTISPEKLEELTSFFKTEIVKELSKDYELVDEPGNDVAQIQVAITEIIPGKLFSNIFPVSVAINSATGRGKGGASLEMKVVDSKTNTLLGQATSRRKNKGYIESFSKFGNARGVMTYWAKLLKERIDLFKSGQ